MNRLSLGRPVQTFLQFRKLFGGLVFFTGLNQGQEFLLGGAGSLEKNPIHLASAKGGTGLFGGRGSIGHKGKSCRREAVGVNP